MNVTKKCQNSPPNKTHFRQKMMNADNETLDVNVQKTLSASKLKKSKSVKRRIPLSKENIQQGHQKQNCETNDESNRDAFILPTCFTNLHHYIYIDVTLPSIL